MSKKQLINARALMEYARNQKSGTIDCNDIARFPTVDAVEVVWCGECRFCDTEDCPMRGTPGEVSASDFCSYGERRTNNEKS